MNLGAREVHGPIIAGLARCTREDIDTAWCALKDAAGPRIHVFLATSAIHREFKLNMAKEQVVQMAVEGVTFARSLCADVEFSPEDASRTELEFLACSSLTQPTRSCGLKMSGYRAPTSYSASTAADTHFANAYSSSALTSATPNSINFS